MPSELSPVIAASTRWLLAAFPPAAGPLDDALAEAQARHAATIAAALCYPTALDAGLLVLLGPGGCTGLDAVTGAGTPLRTGPAPAWHAQVDETVVSWAACLLADPDLAALAAACLGATHHGSDGVGDARRLTVPSPRDHRAAPLLRHPDLLGPVADLHRETLLGLLHAGRAGSPGRT
ncbi:hypothetical protein GCM10011579_032230 [Streptomyces albiflavescens]|uniref:Uncharacterized protein n=1 Tax=Streptomyces albiflavescens TaxID=1623582 RepID=A0A917Y1E3_9ACTN|nr:hypothetical protein [Streptomyces albiflavescens]GGN63654.1 hypothetical protein GCM10011579_032230 [Streptomyces albiflavescens]